jgi:RNA polymerase sigma factor (sigma-70 family)
MSESWLKIIGTSDKPCPETWTKNHVHFRKDKPSGIRSGDRIVLYAVARQKQIFALAEVTSDVYEIGQPEWRYQMDVNYSVNLPVQSGVSIDRITGRDLVGPIIWGSSYVELQPVDAIMQEELRDRIEQVLHGLTYRERCVIMLRYGLGDGYTYTLEEVGRIFKVTRQRVCQIEAKAKRKLSAVQIDTILECVRAFIEAHGNLLERDGPS